jgi:hypothetical protein
MFTSHRLSIPFTLRPIRHPALHAPRKAMRISLASTGRSSGRTNGPPAPCAPGRTTRSGSCPPHPARPYPIAPKLRALQLATALQLDDQPPTRQADGLAIGRMPRIGRKGCTDGDQFDPRERQHQFGPLKPEDGHRSPATPHTGTGTSSPAAAATPSSCAARTTECSGRAPLRSEKLDSSRLMSIPLRAGHRWSTRAPANRPGSNARHCSRRSPRREGDSGPTGVIARPRATVAHRAAPGAFRPAAHASPAARRPGGVV